MTEKTVMNTYANGDITLHVDT